MSRFSLGPIYELGLYVLRLKLYLVGSVVFCLRIISFLFVGLVGFEVEVITKFGQLIFSITSFIRTRNKDRAQLGLLIPSSTSFKLV